MSKRNAAMPPPWDWTAGAGNRNFVGRPPWGAARGAGNPVQQQAIAGASQVSTGMSLTPVDRQRMPYAWAAGGRSHPLAPGSEDPPNHQGGPAPSMNHFKHNFPASQPRWPSSLHSQQEADHQTFPLDGYGGGGSQHADFPPPPASQPSQTAARLLEELNGKTLTCPPAHQPSCPIPPELPPIEAADTLAEMTTKLDTKLDAVAENNADMLLIMRGVAQKLNNQDNNNPKSAQLTALTAAVQDLVSRSAATEHAVQHIAQRPSLREAATQTSPTAVAPLAAASAASYQGSKQHLLSIGAMPQRRPRSATAEKEKSPALQPRNEATHGISPLKKAQSPAPPSIKKLQPAERLTGLESIQQATKGQQQPPSSSVSVKRHRQHSTDSIACPGNANGNVNAYDDDSTSSEEEEDDMSRRLARRVNNHRKMRLRLQTNGTSKAEP